MKPVNLQTLILPVIGWIYDFQKDNNRLPDSLEDLIANKSPKRDYDPGRAIKRSETNGFHYAYKIQDSGAFEITITKENETVIYNSSTDDLSFFKDNAFIEQTKLK